MSRRRVRSMAAFAVVVWWLVAAPVTLGTETDLIFADGFELGNSSTWSAVVEFGCTPGDWRCSGGNAQVCDASGQWILTEVCSVDCLDGDCVGYCTQDGEQRCVGNAVEGCVDGQWVFIVTCPYACAVGTCTGVCIPGVRQCNGQTVEICNVVGAWQTETVCPGACVGGACVEQCSQEGELRCSGDFLERCSEGSWIVVQLCEFGCVDGTCL